MRNTVLLCLIMTSVNVGCVPDRLTVERREALKEAPSVVFVHREPEPFEVVTESNINMLPGQSGLVLFLCSACRVTHTPKGDGARVRNEISIGDPSEQIKRDIAQYVSEIASLKNVRIIDAVQPKGDLPSELRTSPAQIFSFRTLMWALMYYRFDTSFHYLMFSGEGRLIDSTTGDTVWRSTCDYIEDAPRMSRPSLDDYAADGGKRLRAELARAAQSCTQQLKKHLIH
jgi:hypothetical protein